MFPTGSLHEKDTSLNDELDRLRLSATRSMLERRDVIIVSSVSCIYGIGAPEEYGKMLMFLKIGERFPRSKMLERLVEQYDRNDMDFHRGKFRVRGDVVDIYLAESESAIRVELFGDEIERIIKFEPLTGKKRSSHQHYVIYPASHYATSPDHIPDTVKMIREELQTVSANSISRASLWSPRLKQRTVRSGNDPGNGGCSNRKLQPDPAEVHPEALGNPDRLHALGFVGLHREVMSPCRGAGMFSVTVPGETLVEHGFAFLGAGQPSSAVSEFQKIPQNLLYVLRPLEYEMEQAGNDTLN